MRTVKEIAAYERDLNNERQFGKQALRLVEKGDYPAALKAKQRQLVSMQLYTEGKKANERIEKQRQDLLKYYTSEGRRDKIAADYLEKIEDILERFELRVSKQGPSVQRERMSAAKYVAEMDAAGRQDEVAPEARLLAELNERMTWRNMTSAEVEHLVGTIQNLAHLGRTKDSLLKAQEKRKFRAVIDSLVDRMNLTGKLPGVTRERSPTKTTTETLVDALREGHSWLMRPEHQARSLDGGELGPVWEAIFRPISEAGDVESRMMREATTPRTPMCQSRLPATIEAWVSGLKFLATHSSASRTTWRSTPWRSRLWASSPSASRDASAGSSASRSWSASMAGPRRPAALMRGPMRKLISPAFTGVGTSATRWRAANPAQRVRSICRRPWLTKILFSSTRGTMSATVASATRSRYSRRSTPSTGRAFKMAWASLKTTPALQR
jgi:hypothetical protein